MDQASAMALSMRSMQYLAINREAWLPKRLARRKRLVRVRTWTFSRLVGDACLAQAQNTATCAVLSNRSDMDDELGPWPSGPQEDSGALYENASFCTLTTADNGSSQRPSDNCPAPDLAPPLQEPASPQPSKLKPMPVASLSPTAGEQRHPSTSEIRELAEAEVRQSLTPSLRRLWRPPRATHPRECIDPRYLQTQANSWVQRPGVGVVYDWKAQHEQNNAILRMRQAETRKEAIVKAIIKQQENHMTNQAAYREWLMIKRQEQVLQRYAYKSVIGINALPVFDPPSRGTLANREAGWEKSTTTAEVRKLLGRGKVINRPGKIAALSESLDAWK